MLAQEFCVGGTDGTYGGYYPHGIPDTLSPVDWFTVLALSQYPGRATGSNPTNFSGLVYIADLVGPQSPTKGEWSVARCQNYFNKILSMCGGFFGGEASDPTLATFRLYASAYSTPNNSPKCWDKNHPESRCMKWSQIKG